MFRIVSTMADLVVQGGEFTIEYVPSVRRRQGSHLAESIVVPFETDPVSQFHTDSGLQYEARTEGPCDIEVVCMSLC